jgi:hypothetical protein
MAAVDYRQYPNLITAAEVVDKAMTNSNMDASIIDDNIILIAEITHIKEHLGSYFWGNLRLDKNSASWATNSVYADKRTLVHNYIQPCLALYVKYEVLNDMQYNTSSSGVTLNVDEWSEAVDDSDLSVLKEDTFRKAEILRKDMIEWLDQEDNKGVFTEYEHDDNVKHRSGNNVTRIAGILAYGNDLNYLTEYKKYKESNDDGFVE